MKRNQGAFIAAQAVIFAVVLILVSFPLESTGTQQTTGLSSSTSSATTSTTSSTTTSQAIETVNSSFIDHVHYFGSGSVSALVAEYESNATVSWSGSTNGLGGNYVGIKDIGLLLHAFLGSTGPFLEIHEVSQEMSMNASAASVNSILYFAGFTQNYGIFNFTVSAQDTYGYSSTNDAWMISGEKWDFLNFNAQFGGFEVGCTGSSSCPQWVENMTVSADGKYLVAGATAFVYSGAYNGSVYLVSLQEQSQGVLWKYMTDTAVSSVAISSDGSFVAAGGFWSDNSGHGHGEVFLFNNEGQLLWNVSIGDKPQAVEVAIAANGSRIAADYGTGVLYLDSAGHILWNYTFPQGGISSHIAMSSDARFMVYTDENITMPNTTRLGWGVFYLNSLGHQLWSYSEDHAGFSSVQISSDGSRVAASSRLSFYSYEGANTDLSYNGSAYYFDGGTGALLWEDSYYPDNGFVMYPTLMYSSLVMSPDDTYIAFGGPASGVFYFSSSGKILWSGSAGVLAEPASIIQNDSLVLMYGIRNEETLVTGADGNAQARLVAGNGTLVAAYLEPGLSDVAGFSGGTEWVAVGGSIGAGGCATLSVFDGVTAVRAISLC